MIRTRRWRLRWIVPVLLTAGVALALFIAQRAWLAELRRQLADSLSASDVARIATDVANAWTVAILAVLLVILMIGITLGSALAHRVERLRAETLAQARGTGAQRMTQSSIAEIHAVSSAVEFLVAEFSERAASLARDRDELALLVNSVSEGILQVDADARVVRANPAAHELLNLPAHVRGQPVQTLIRNTELRVLLARAADGEVMPTTEVTLDDRRILVISRPFTEGDAAGTIVAFVDLTELRRLEGVRRDFVANVSHELKTPLTSIRGYVETLLSDDLPADMQQQFLDVVQKNAERLHHIVEDLLDLSRLESGGWVPELHTVNPAELAHDVWSIAAERPEARAINFSVTGDSPAIIADPRGMRQVLANLFDNAIRYTPTDGSITVHISTARPAKHTSAKTESLVPAGSDARSRTASAPAPDASGHATSGARTGTTASGWATIEVRDTGAGIPRDALARVFERFYRVDPARSRAEGGTGLGLSIVRHLVERMGGEVSAESDLGKGTAIRIRLPAAATPAIVRQNAG